MHENRPPSLILAKSENQFPISPCYSATRSGDEVLAEDRVKRND